MLSRYMSSTHFSSIFVILLSIIACAPIPSRVYDSGKPMAISPEKKYLNTDNESVAFLLIRTRNTINDGYLPEIFLVEILDRNSKKTILFNCTKSMIHPTEAFLDHLVSFQLPPGEYEIQKLEGYAQVNRSQAMSILILPGYFEWEIRGMFHLNPKEIVYLGHLELTNRYRNEGEKSSGWVIPIVPQKVSGFSIGTFDVSVDDRMKEDMQLVSNYCQWINEYEINPSILILRTDKETK